MKTIHFQAKILIQWKEIAFKWKMISFYICFLNFRYNLPIVLLVVNNGIYQGFDTDSWKEMLKFGDATTV